MITLYRLLLLSPYLAVAAKQNLDVISFPDPATGTKLICEPFGPCLPCPSSSLHEPYCQPFGNRRVLHCRPEGSSSADGERPVFGSCGRVVAQERADFFEFLMCNVAFACLGLVMVLVRSRRMADMQARTLAARIGLTRAPRR